MDSLLAGWLDGWINGIDPTVRTKLVNQAGVSNDTRAIFRIFCNAIFYAHVPIWVLL